jgi:hypothetical protein
MLVKIILDILLGVETNLDFSVTKTVDSCIMIDVVVIVERGDDNLDTVNGGTCVDGLTVLTEVTTNIVVVLGLTVPDGSIGTNELVEATGAEDVFTPYISVVADPPGPFVVPGTVTGGTPFELLRISLEALPSVETNVVFSVGGIVDIREPRGVDVSDANDTEETPGTVFGGDGVLKTMVLVLIVSTVACVVDIIEKVIIVLQLTDESADEVVEGKAVDFDTLLLVDDVTMLGTEDTVLVKLSDGVGVLMLCVTMEG